MNMPVEKDVAASTSLTELQEGQAASLAVIMNPELMKGALSLAKVMSTSSVTVPKHLQGKEGDCLAIVLQAMNWGLNPFAVAQKTHLVNGVLGYEAQLVNAVVQSQKQITGTFSYEFRGEGEDIECRVGAVLRNQKDITWGEWLKSRSVTTKNSPLWKTNPRQQLAYLQVKNWARLYAPGAILGVYSDDELQSIPEKDITQEGTHVTGNQQKPEPTYYTNEEFAEKKEAWKKSLIDGNKEPERFIAFIESKGKLLTEAQKAEIGVWKKPAPATIEGSAIEVDDPFIADMNAEEQKGKQ